MAIVIRDGTRYCFHFAFSGKSIHVYRYERETDGYRMYIVVDPVGEREMEVDEEEGRELARAIEAVNAGTTALDELESMLTAQLDALE